MLIVLMAMILIASCASSANECSWVKRFQPDAEFEERWTADEKRQAVAHNRKVEKFCR